MESDPLGGSGHITKPKSRGIGGIKEPDSPHAKFAVGPDRGIAWAIALAGFWINLVSMGLNKASGVTFVAFIDYYNVTREQASWPSSVQFAALSLSSPITAVLCGWVSLRIVASSGSILAALGVCLSYFVNNITAVTFLFGLLQGIGTSLLLIPAILMITKYFKERRATAFGILQAGASVGAFIFPPAIDALLQSRGLHNTFLCMSTILLTSLCAAAFFSLPKWHNEQQPSGVAIEPTFCKKEDQTIAQQCDYYHQQEYKPTAVETTNGNHLHNHTDSTISCNTGHRSETAPPAVLVPYISIENSEKVPLLGGHHHHHHHRHHSHLSGAGIHTDPHPTILDISGSWEECLQEMVRSDGRKWVTVKRICGILQHPMFWVIQMVSLDCSICYLLYQQIVVDYADQWNMSTSDGSVLISVMSGLELLGQGGTGWISDFGFVTPKKMTSVLAGFNGLMFLIIPYCPNTQSFVALSVIVSFGIGAIMPIIHVVQVDYLGQENFSMAVALSLFLSGCITLFRPLMIGYFRDTIGSYNGLIFLFTGMFLLTSILWLCEPLIIRSLWKRQAKEDRTVSYQKQQRTP